MADSRIYDLDDYSSLDDMYLMGDASGLSAAIKIPVSYLTGLIAANQSGIAQNTSDIAENASNIEDVDTRLQVFEDTISKSTCTNQSSKLTTSSVCYARKSGKIILITGQIQADSALTENEGVFTLPSTFPYFNYTDYFAASGADPNENYELKTVAGTRTIRAGAGSSADGTAYFCVTVLVD